MGDVELLTMLAAETERRSATVIEAIRDLAASTEPDSDKVEEIRIEIHGLKGAASVVGATRLAELAQKIEVRLVERTAPGTLTPGAASALIDATEALRDGASAASRGEPEPSSVAAGLSALADG